MIAGACRGVSPLFSGVATGSWVPRSSWSRMVSHYGQECHMRVPEDMSMMYYLLLSHDGAGKLPHSFPVDSWNRAVAEWHFCGGDSVPFAGGFHDSINMPKDCARIFTETPVKEWLFFDHTGKFRGAGLRDIAALITDSKDFPLWACLPKRRYVVMRSNPLRIECTGLGGGGLNSPQPRDMCIQTAKNHENVYGPCMARVEQAKKNGERDVQVIALGLTKDTHEFLVLHYYACDSAKLWNALPCLRNCHFMRADRRRKRAFEMLQEVHIAPSYCRNAHPCWNAALSLVTNLLWGVRRKELLAGACWNWCKSRADLQALCLRLVEGCKWREVW